MKNISDATKNRINNLKFGTTYVFKALGVGNPNERPSNLLFAHLLDRKSND
jgi:hypothetical protein